MLSFCPNTVRSSTLYLVPL